ncbi:MAG: hypothetical protein ACXV48_04105 [Halobacteriota archaeon]
MCEKPLGGPLDESKQHLLQKLDERVFKKDCTMGLLRGIKDSDLPSG